MDRLFSKVLTKTDIEKRLSVPSEKKQCFLDFGGKYKEEIKVIDEKGQVWEFGCSIRKEPYPKPVFSKGWLRFVHCWKLAIGDRVILCKKQDKAGGKWDYVIQVMRKATKLYSFQNRDDADRTKAVASYSKVEEETAITSHITDQASHSNIEDEPTLPSQSTDHSITSGRTEVADRIGLRLEFFILKPQTKAREPEFLDFLELGSRERREREQPSSLTLYHNVENPVLKSTPPYYKFI